MGTFIAEEELTQSEAMAAGDYAVRVVPGVPSTAGLLRLDQLIAAMAQTRPWLTDAYFAGTTSYIQAIRSAAESGVDVHRLVESELCQLARQLRIGLGDRGRALRLEDGRNVSGGSGKFDGDRA